MNSIREHVRRLPERTQTALWLAMVLVLSIASVELGKHVHGTAAWGITLALYALLAVTYLVVRRRRQ